MADLAALRQLLTSRRSELFADDNEWEQFQIYLEAFATFIEREKKYHSLWKQYGAGDSYHHVTSKAARTQFYLTGNADSSDPIDLINYTAFLIRNVRAGRMTSSLVGSPVELEMEVYGAAEQGDAAGPTIADRLDRLERAVVAAVAWSPDMGTKDVEAIQDILEGKR